MTETTMHEALDIQCQALQEIRDNVCVIRDNIPHEQKEIANQTRAGLAIVIDLLELLYRKLPPPMLNAKLDGNFNINTNL